MPACIGFYGGTFDPIHLGHLQVARAANTAFGFAGLHLVPSADPPLRAATDASAAQRLAMVRLAAAEQPGFLVDDRELHRAGPSYTYDTLAQLRVELGATQPLAWLLGCDALLHIERWHRWDALLTLAHIVVMDRPYVAAPKHPQVLRWIRDHRCERLEAVHEAHAGALVFFAGPRVQISATAVRLRCRAGASAADLLPLSVWHYICAQGLYGASGNSLTERETDVCF